MGYTIKSLCQVIATSTYISLFQALKILSVNLYVALSVHITPKTKLLIN
jgi:hypothetical protein